MLLEILPLLTGDDTKGLKFAVEKLLGFLIGVFGLVIGYDYEKVSQSVAKKKGKALGIKPLDTSSMQTGGDEDTLNSKKAKFSCDLKIHKYEHASEAVNIARRQSMAFGLLGKRMSVSTDRLYSHQHTASHLHTRQLSDNNLSVAADKLRRFSMAPGSLETMMPHKSRHTSDGSLNHGHRDFDEKDSLQGGCLVTGDGDSDMQDLLDMEHPDETGSCYDEDTSELLSMQVETYMDAE